MSDNTYPRTEFTYGEDSGEDSGGEGSGQNRLRGANTMRRRNVLGRGLSALMSGAPVGIYEGEKWTAEARPDPGPEREETASSDAGRGEELEGGLVYLALERLMPSRVQPRQIFDADDIRSLSESISATGLLQPIVVRRIPGESGALANFEIVAGERRWRAAKTAGLAKIPAVVRQLSDREALEFGIIENVQRADLNPVEEAHAYQRLIMDFGATQQEIARTAGKDRTSIANALRLLRLPPEVQELLVQGALSAGHGRALLMLDNPGQQQALAELIVQEGLSVRAAESLAARGELSQPPENGETARKTRCAGTAGPEVKELEERFRRALGTKVRLQLKKNGKGDLRISFFSAAELESLLERFNA